MKKYHLLLKEGQLRVQFNNVISFYKELKELNVLSTDERWLILEEDEQMLKITEMAEKNHIQCIILPE